MKINKRNKKGFTLVECVVAIAVISIITMSVIGLVQSSYSIDTGVSELFKAKNIANSALKVFECSSNNDEFLNKLAGSNSGIDPDALVNKTSQGAEITFDEKYSIDEIKAESTGGYSLKFLNKGAELFSLSFDDENEWAAAIEYVKGDGKFDLLTEQYSFTADVVSGGLTNKFKARFARAFAVNYRQNTISGQQGTAKVIGYSDDMGYSFEDEPPKIAGVSLMSKDTKVYDLQAIGEGAIAHQNGKKPTDEIKNYLKTHKDSVKFNLAASGSLLGTFDETADCDYKSAVIKLAFADFKCAGEKITLNKADLSNTSSATKLTLYDVSNHVFFTAQNFKNFEEKNALIDSTSQTKAASSYYSYQKARASTTSILDASKDGKHTVSFGNFTITLDDSALNEIKNNIGDCTTSYRTEQYGVSGKDIQIDGPYYKLIISKGFDTDTQRLKRVIKDKTYYLTKGNQYLSTSDGTGDNYYFTESEMNEFLSNHCFEKDGKYYYGFTKAEKTETGKGLSKRYHIKLTDKAGKTLYFCNTTTKDYFLTFSSQGYTGTSNRDDDYNLLVSKTGSFNGTTVYYPMEITIDEVYSVYYHGTYTYRDFFGQHTAEADFYFNGSNFDRENPQYTSAANKDVFLSKANLMYNFSDTLTVAEKATVTPWSVYAKGAFDDKYVITVKNKSVDVTIESGSLDTEASSNEKTGSYRTKISNPQTVASTVYDPSGIYSKAVFTGEKLNFVNRLGEVIYSTDCTPGEIAAYLENKNNHTKAGNVYTYEASRKIRLKVIYSFPYASVVNADDEDDIIFRHELTKSDFETAMGTGGSSGGLDEHFTSLTENLVIIPYTSENDGTVKYSVVIFTDFKNRKCVAFVVRGDFIKDEDSAVFNNLTVDAYSAAVGDKIYVKGTETTENKVQILYETLVYAKG